MLGQIIALVDVALAHTARTEQLENTLNSLNMTVTNEIKGLMEKTALTIGARAFLKASRRRQSKPLGSDKGSFRMWNEKLINIISQIRPGARIQ